MKALKSKASKLILAFTFVFLFSIQATYAKGFGTETQTITESCGECECTWEVSTFYLFWVAIDRDRELVDIDC